jgi:hypothetical protein
MIDRSHDLPITRQAKVLNVSPVGIDPRLIRKFDDAGGQNGVGCAHNKNTPLLLLESCPSTFSL